MQSLEASYAAWMGVFLDCCGKVDALGHEVPIPILSSSHIINICDLAINILKDQPMLMRIQGPIRIVGDIHGSLHDLIRIFIQAELPTQVNYLFLGDYVDRGEYSLEVITLLLTLFVSCPEKITLLRGNHETREVNATYGFKNEVWSVYRSYEVYEKINDVFDYLPLSAIVDDKFACFHGGISPDLHDMNDILKIPKPLVDTSSFMINNLLWSDPINASNYFIRSPRSEAMIFGLLAQVKFLKETRLKQIIRAHQCIQEGCEQVGKCITVFSASNYSNENNSAILLCDKNSEISVVYFEPFFNKLNRQSTLFYNVNDPNQKNKEICQNAAYPLSLKGNQPTGKIRKSQTGRFQNSFVMRRVYSCRLKSLEQIPTIKHPQVTESFKLDTIC